MSSLATGGAARYSGEAMITGVIEDCAKFGIIPAPT